jgi:polyether ionophore transport system permease protein
MSADLALGTQARAGRWPNAVIAGLTARKAVRSAAVWGVVFGLYVASSALGYTATYKTSLARAQLAATFGNNLGFNALIGPAHQIGTVAGFTAWRALGVLSIVGSVWGLLAGTRLLRGEEDAGRWESLLAGQTTRRGAAAKALAGLAVGLLALWTIAALITMAVGRVSSVRIGAAASLYLALALACGAAVFLAAGVLASQLAPTRRRAASYCAGALGICYALRMTADSGTGLSWLRWLSPLGWIEELRPLTSPRPLMLIPIVALVALMAGLAIRLAGSRDLGSSVIADRSSARPRTGLLTGPAGLSIRLTRGVLTGWVVSIASLGLLMGLIAKSAGGALAQNAGDRDTFAKMGFRGSGALQYLAITFLLVALLVALIAAGQLTAARSEEAEGRVDHLLVRPVSRYSWLAGRLTVAAGYLLVAGLIAGVTSWLAAASQNTGVGLGTMLGAGLNVVPPAVFVLGAGVLTLGVRPRAVAAVAYGLLAWSFLVELIGGLVNASHWILDTSLFHQMTAAPAISPDWTSNAILTALGLAAAAAGAVAFRRRDLAGA